MRLGALPIAMTLVTLILPACAGSTPMRTQEAGISAGQEDKSGKKDEDESGKISRAQLQDALIRYQASFSESLRESFRPLDTSSDPKIRTQAVRSRLNYVSSSLDIVLGAIPEANLLDMVAFIELSRDAYSGYWLPKVYGKKGEKVLQAFNSADESIWAIAAKILSPEQMNLLHEILAKWRDDHKGQIAVEGVRLTQFSAVTGERASELQNSVSGLLSQVTHATHAADQAVLLGERSLRYAEMLPFLARMQARAGVTDVAESGFDVLERLVEIYPQLKDPNQILEQSAELARVGGAALKEGAIVTQQLREILDLMYRNRTPEFSKLRNEMITGVIRIMQEYNRALASPVHAQTIQQINGLAERMKSTTDALLIHATLALMAVILFAALSFVLARILFTLWRDRHLAHQATDDRTRGGRAA